MKSTSLGAFALLVGIGAFSIAAQACPNEALVLSVGKAFNVAAKSGSPNAFVSAASRHTDMRALALFALGPHRKKLSKAQEGEYIRLAKDFIGRFMAKYADRFKADGLKVVSCSGGTITATADGGRKLIFRVDGGQLKDVNVSSVWLAGQMRSTFVGLINRNNGDIEALLRYLRS
jgi:ABC-type transporter MlaC component